MGPFCQHAWSHYSEKLWDSFLPLGELFVIFTWFTGADRLIFHMHLGIFLCLETPCAAVCAKVRVQTHMFWPLRGEIPKPLKPARRKSKGHPLLPKAISKSDKGRNLWEAQVSGLQDRGRDTPERPCQCMARVLLSPVCETPPTQLKHQGAPMGQVG